MPLLRVLHTSGKILLEGVADSIPVQGDTVVIGKEQYTVISWPTYKLTEATPMLGMLVAIVVEETHVRETPTPDKAIEQRPKRRAWWRRKQHKPTPEEG